MGVSKYALSAAKPQKNTPVSPLLTVHVPVNYYADKESVSGFLLNVYNMEVNIDDMRHVVIRNTHGWSAVEYKLAIGNKTVIGDERASFCFINDNPTVIRCDPDSLTSVEIVMLLRKGVVTAFVKVLRRRRVVFQALFDSNGVQDIRVDELKQNTQEISEWRIKRRASN